jgi:hypothetical protein
MQQGELVVQRSKKSRKSVSPKIFSGTATGHRHHVAHRAPQQDTGTTSHTGHRKPDTGTTSEQALHRLHQ